MGEDMADDLRVIAEMLGGVVILDGVYQLKSDAPGCEGCAFLDRTGLCIGVAAREPEDSVIWGCARGRKSGQWIKIFPQPVA